MAFAVSLAACSGGTATPTPIYDPAPTAAATATRAATPTAAPLTSPLPTVTPQPRAAATPTAAPRAASAPFKAQITRFIELGSKMAASAADGTLAAFTAQVTEMNAILKLLIDAGGADFPVAARKDAEAAAGSWSEALVNWQYHEATSARPNAADRALMTAAAKSFELAKTALAELVK